MKGQGGHPWSVVTPDLDTLLIALYVEIDDHVIPSGLRGPGQPKKLADAELACLAVAQVLLGARSEHHWLRLCRARLGHLFPYVPKQPGYHKRVKAAAPLLAAVMDHLARQCPSWYDQARLIDARPVPCGTSRETVKRSELAGWAGYGYCAAYSRWYWGLKLYLITTPDGMPVTWCLARSRWDASRCRVGLTPAASLRRPSVIRYQAAFRVWSGWPPAAMAGSQRWPVVMTAGRWRSNAAASAGLADAPAEDFAHSPAPEHIVQHVPAAQRTIHIHHPRLAASAISKRAAPNDDLTGSRAIAGLCIPDLDLDVVTVADNPTALSVVTGEAAEADLAVGPGEDVASDQVARAVSPAGAPSLGAISDFEVLRIGC